MITSPQSARFLSFIAHLLQSLLAAQILGVDGPHAVVIGLEQVMGGLAAKHENQDVLSRTFWPVTHKEGAVGRVDLLHDL